MMFYVTCECNRRIVTQEPEGYCSRCGRKYTIRWNDTKTTKERFYDLFGDYALSPVAREFKAHLRKAISDAASESSDPELL